MRKLLKKDAGKHLRRSRSGNFICAESIDRLKSLYHINMQIVYHGHGLSKLGMYNINIANKFTVNEFTIFLKKCKDEKCHCAISKELRNRIERFFNSIYVEDVGDVLRASRYESENGLLNELLRRDINIIKVDVDGLYVVVTFSIKDDNDIGYFWTERFLHGGFR
mgnify:CR=1 FL=1